MNDEMSQEQPMRRRPGRPRLDKPNEPVEGSAAAPRVSRRGNRVAVHGRDGELLTRNRPASGDKFYIPEGLVPDGWCYEWKAEIVRGEQQMSHLSNLMENGWRAVPASRHDGVFMSAGTDGPIRRDGQLLMERPMALTQEAIDEERAKAFDLIQTQREAIGLKVGRGFSTKERGTGTNISGKYEHGDAPRPALEVERE